ncbi:hypothetical protein C8J56DRAFT_896152 [Mycena floridula]|nr:hypothetical protein C8J56DRAFT_896152 [Mycena floridula]
MSDEETAPAPERHHRETASERIGFGKWPSSIRQLRNGTNDARKTKEFNLAQGKGENKCKAEQVKERGITRLKQSKAKEEIGSRNQWQSKTVKKLFAALKQQETGLRVGQRKEKVREKAAQRKPSMKKAKKE